jgi:hypothetical protein
MDNKSHTFHVLYTPTGQWSLRRHGADRASRNFATRDAAVRFGKDFAQRNGFELFIHRSDGSVETRNTYAQQELAISRTKK